MTESPTLTIADSLKQLRHPPIPIGRGIPNHEQEKSMRELNHDFRQICRRNQEGRPTTQRDRERMLDWIASELHEMGCCGLRAQNLKPRHVEKLVERWIGLGRSAGTLKNRMTTLRWLAEKIGKPNLVAPTNAAYQIPSR